MHDQWDRVRDQVKTDKKTGTPRLAPISLPDSDVKSEEPARFRERRRFGLFGRKRVVNERPEHKGRRRLKRVAKVGALLMTALIGIIILKGWLTISNIIDRDGNGAVALQDKIDPTQLKGEGDGRINIMIVGIGGKTHEAGNLADTIIIASIDPFSKEVAMLSVPRDMYVSIPGYGSEKINAAHAYGEEFGYNGKSKGAGIALLKKTVEETLDIPIHYYVRVDFQGFVQAVDTVGGIDLNVPEPVYDTNFVWQYGVLDVKAGQQHFDGKKALYYARSRYTSTRGDFSRNERQRAIILALKDKVLSAGTYANPTKILALLSAAGNHVRTNIGTSEAMRLYEIIKEVPANKIISVGLDNSPDNYLIGQNINGAAVMVPKAGLGNYSVIQKYVRGLFVDGFIKSEAATIDVLNGAGTAGLATKSASQLKSYGYKVVKVADAPTSDNPTTQIYDLSNGTKPFTKQLLEKRFKITVQPGSALPQKVTTTSNFVIILGQDATTSSP